MKATTAMNTATPVSVAGSVGLTLNSCACSSRVRPNDAARPATSPMIVSRSPCAEDHPEHAAARRAERHVDPDLLRPLADRVRQDAVGADRRERQREAGEDRQQLREETRPRRRVSEHLVHRPHLDDRQRRILRADRLLDLPRQSVLGEAERTTRFMLDGEKPVKRGPCSLRKYSSVPVLLAMPPCFTSRTTPTIVNGVVLFGGRPVKMLTRWPTASSLRKVKKVFSSVSLTSMTGAPLTSAGSKPRPFTTGIPIVFR